MSTGRKCDLGTMITTHAINSNRDHGKLAAPSNRSADRGNIKRKRPGAAQMAAPGPDWFGRSGFRLGLDYFATAVKAGRADMVTYVRFAGGGLHGGGRADQ